MKKDTINGLLCVVGAALIHLTFGYFYTIGNMIPYISSYLRETGNEVFLSALALAFQGVSMPIGGLCNKKLGFRLTAILSCFLNSAGVILTYWTIKAGFVPVLLTYSVLLALGFGLAYSVVLQLAICWFPQKRGIVVGVIVGGFGAGAVLFTPIQLAYVNPNNIKVNTTTKFFDDPELLERIPSLFLLCGGILMALQIVGCILLRKKEDQPITKEDGSETEKEQKAEDETMTMRQIFTRGEFYITWVLMFCHTIPITIIASLYKKFGQTLVNDDYYLTAVATMSSIFNASGRICWGLIVDRLSFKLSLYLQLCLWLVSNVTFPFLSFVSSEATVKALFPIWVALLFFSFSGTFVLMPTTTSKIFGPINMSIVYGFIFSAFSVGSLSCAVVTNWLDGQWFALFNLGATVNFIAICLVSLLPDKDMNPRLNFFKPLTDRLWGVQPPPPKKRDSIQVTNGGGPWDNENDEEAENVPLKRNPQV